MLTSLLSLNYLRCILLFPDQIFCCFELSLLRARASHVQVASNESKNIPLILLVKDIEKVMVGNSDAYAILKNKLENLAESVVVIGSHTQLDNRKEKVCFRLSFL